MSISVFEHPVLLGLFGDPAMARIFSARAQCDHMIATEAAFAAAMAEAGQIPADAAARICEALAVARIAPEDLAASTGRDGVVVPELVARLREGLDPRDQDFLHTGMTSQDVIDTSLALAIADLVACLTDRVAALQASLDGLADRFGPRPLIARTRMQAALPTTVATRIAAWHGPTQSWLKRLSAAALPLQLGGPIGIFMNDETGARVAALMADRLGLALPPRPWHTDRTPITGLGNLLADMSGALGKIGQDIALMAQQGIDEIALIAGGSSSAMAHKSNPVGAETLITLARFNATQISGLHHSLTHEQERSGAAWALEWMILPQMAAATGRGLALTIALIDTITRIGTPPQDRA